MSNPSLVRRPYSGSCHCKKVKYIAYLTLPKGDPNSTATKLTGPELKEQSGHRIYKCNCTTCHKIGYFHLRLPYAPKDFILLTPGPGTPFDNSDPILKSYNTTLGGGHQWQFCGNCGARCFTTNWKLQDIEMEVPAGLVNEEAKGNYPSPPDGESEPMVTVKGQGIQEEGFRDPTREPRDKYFSLNAVTIDPYQEGASLVEWHDNGWIHYMDTLEEVGEERAQKPHIYGMY